jgi:dTMP kinase
VERANTLATGGLIPDLTLLLDVPVEVGLGRRASDGDRNHFDREAVAFHARIRAAFLDLAREGGDGWRIIDADRAFEDVLADAEQAIAGAIGG